jgi:hypothetical protein
LSKLTNAIKEYQMRGYLNSAFRTHKVLKEPILYNLPEIQSLEKIILRHQDKNLNKNLNKKKGIRIMVPQTILVRTGECQALNSYPFPLLFLLLIPADCIPGIKHIWYFNFHSTFGLTKNWE